MHMKRQLNDVDQSNSTDLVVEFAGKDLNKLRQKFGTIGDTKQLINRLIGCDTEDYE